jgi:predicted nucleotidyltransferase
MEKIDNSIQQNEIKQIVMNVLSNQNITASKIILFGSRARNDFNKDSDWEKHIASDIIIRSQSEIKKFTKRVNSVTKTAIEEGIPLK